MSQRGGTSIRGEFPDPSFSAPAVATDPAPRAGRTAAVAGAGLGAAMTLAVVGSAEIVGAASDHGGARLIGAAVILAVLTTLGLWPGWSRLPPVALLVFPLVCLAGIAGFGLTTGAVSSYYSGLIVLLFLYAGLTQRPWTSLLLVPFAIPAWLTLYQELPGPAIWLRLPIALLTWAAVGEITSRHNVVIAEQSRRLGHLAGHDQLTGLQNRRGLPGVLDRLRPGAVILLIDVDHFKLVNDQRGHLEGDRLLADLGRLIRSCVRAGDTAVRYGGEEFLIVLSGGGMVAGQSLDHRLRAVLAEANNGITYSAGLTTLAPGDTAATALARADAAMYEAKNAGRDRTNQC